MKQLLTVLALLLCLNAKADVGMLDAAAWIGMEEVDTIVAPLIHAPFAKEVLGDRKVGEYTMPVFMRDFKARRNVYRATLFVCGLGHFNVYLDGQKVGDHFLDPGWTLYDKEALFVKFDVTRWFKEDANNVLAEFAQRIKRGEHELRVELGGGFYNVPRGRYNKLVGSYGQPKLRLRLLLEYTQGRDDNIVTNSEWLVGESPITFSSIYGGEDVDLRIDPNWRPAIVLGYDGPKLREQQGTELLVWGEFKPLNKWQTPSGDWVYDFGQNMSGIMNVTLKGEDGQEVAFIPAELKDKDGNAYNKPVGDWEYHVTLRNQQKVNVEPKFSYTGFRYIQVHGAVPAGEANPGGLPVIETIVAKHTTSACAAKEAGTFKCNNEYLNQVHQFIDWAIRSNLQSVPTDCPHREKLGWLEQDYLMMPSMYYRYNLTPLYRKLMCDMEASQFVKGQTLGYGAESTSWIKEGHDLEGMIPTIAPYFTNFGWNFDDTPEWGSAFIICPWYHYEWTGSDELFRNHFGAMQRYIDYLTRRARKNGYILDYGLGDWYDLGPKQPGFAQLTTQGVTATATYYYDVTLMAKMARVLEQPAVASQYEALADSIRTAYNAKFFNADKCCYDRNSQTANAISLYMGLVPEEYKAGVLDNIVNDVEGRIYAIDNKVDSLYEWGENGPTVITAGDVGYRYLLQVLAQGGRNDVIYAMNSRDDVPGYGIQLKNGATTLTESWQGLERVSNNHLMLGHIVEWLYGYIGGIRQQEGSVGWQRVLIEPHPVGGVTDCVVSYQTPKGPLKVHWWIEGNQCKIEYTAPKSMQVEVINPAAELSRMMNN